jgi:hypothetical protein
MEKAGRKFPVKLSFVDMDTIQARASMGAAVQPAETAPQKNIPAADFIHEPAPSPITEPAVKQSTTGDKPPLKYITSIKISKPRRPERAEPQPVEQPREEAETDPVMRQFLELVARDKQARARPSWNR